MDIGKTGELYAENIKTGEFHKIGKTLDFEMQKEPVDQWNHGGHCEFCRRKKYCGTPCKARQNRRQSILNHMVAEAFMNVLKGK